MKLEVWKEINGYLGLYEISNLGKIKSLKKELILKHKIEKSGYHRIKLCRNGDSKLHSVHRLVLESFKPNIHNLPQINHIDGDKSNNALFNLEWCTLSENILHSRRILGKCIGSNSTSSKLTEDSVLTIRKRIDKGDKIREIAKEFKVHDSTIQDIKSKRTWKHI